MFCLYINAVHVMLFCPLHSVTNLIIAPSAEEMLIRGSSGGGIQNAVLFHGHPLLLLWKKTDVACRPSVYNVILCMHRYAVLSLVIFLTIWCY